MVCVEDNIHSPQCHPCHIQVGEEAAAGDDLASGPQSGDQHGKTRLALANHNLLENIVFREVDVLIQPPRILCIAYATWRWSPDTI